MLGEIDINRILQVCQRAAKHALHQETAGRVNGHAAPGVHAAAI
jgi:hypothetical protein